MLTAVLTAVMAAAGLGALGACEGGAPGASEAGGVGGEGVRGGAGLAVVEPWVRTAIAPGAGGLSGTAPVNSAAYVVIRNPGAEPDALVSVETEVADTAELHSVTMDAGIMRMRAVDSVPVPARGEAALEPGGRHVMLIGIRRPLEEGDSVPLTLRFRSGASVDVVAPVRRSPPGP